MRFEDVRETSFACLGSPNGYYIDAIEETWAELIERARQLGLVGEEVDAWGIAHDSPSLTAPERCRYDASVPCPADTRLAAPLFRGHMQAGRYAVFHYTGPVGGVPDAYRSIYSCWFRDRSVAPADFVPLDHYVGDHPKDGQVDVELWLRVRPA